MAILFQDTDGDHYGSIPTLPLILKSYAFCVHKSIGYTQADFKYLRKIGRVVRIVSPDDPQHKWWEVPKADGFVAPKSMDTIVIVRFDDDIGEDMFLPHDLVHIIPLCPN